jgi:hypothetical protein
LRREATERVGKFIAQKEDQEVEEAWDFPPLPEKIPERLYLWGKKWAKERLDELWDGKVDEVLRHCQEHASAGEAVQQAITYFTNNKSRMRYPEYRARGLQIGSGTVECNWSSSQGFWDEMGCRRCKSCSQGEGKTQEWWLG